MSRKNIEENVVKMRFDNSEFDTNVEKSNETLDKFKSALTSLPQNIYIGIQNQISRINLSDILGIGATLAGLGLIKDGIVGLGNEIQSVAYGTLNTINSVVGAAINQINYGGKQRALNIANAKFQIEGLKLSVDTFMEAADYAVSGTAYGLDAAAKVASQLGASGVTELEELKKALRGVSGVAAMTNSSYEEIGDIFTTVASNGRLMTENLRSFSARGLNTSAILAKALNKTEAEINDMVSHAKVDFKMFYTAMDEAFGEHAKDANKTFTGALSNVRAALSRVGEGFWTPILDNSINVFNQLRLAINAFNAELKKTEDDESVLSLFAKRINTIFNNVADMIELVRYSIERTDFVGQFASFFESLIWIFDRLTDAFSIDYSFVMDDIFRNLSNIGTVLRDLVVGFNDLISKDNALRKLGGDFNSLLVWISSFASIFYDIFKDRENTIYDTIGSWIKGLKSVFTTITDILGINRKSFEDLFKNAVNAVFDLIENLKLSDDRIDKITRTFRGAASVLDIIKMAVQAIFNFIKPIFGYIPDAVDGILSISAAIGDWLYNLRNVIKEGQTFEKIFDGIKGIAIFIKDLIKTIGGNFFDAFFGDAAKNETLLNKIKNFIKMIGETVSEAFKNLNIKGIDLSPIQEFIKNLGNFGLSSGDSSAAEGVMDKLVAFFGKIKNAFVKIGEFFQNHIFTIFTGENKTFNKFADFIGQFGDTIKGSLISIRDFVNGIDISEAEAIAIAGLIYTFMICVKDIALAFINGVVELAKVLIIFDGKDTLAIVADKIIDRFLGTRTIGLFDKLNNFLDRFKDINFRGLLFSMDSGQPKEAAIIESIGYLFKSIGTALLGLAAALFVIALIPADRLDAAVKVLLKFIVVIGSMALILSVLNRILPNFNSTLVRAFNLTVAGNNGMMQENPLSAVGVAFAGIAAGLLIISASLAILANLDPDGLEEGARTLYKFALIMSAMMATFMIVNTSMNGDDTGRTLRNIGLAFSAIGLSLLFIAAGIALLSVAIKPEDAAKLTIITVILAAILLVAGILIGLCSQIASSAVNALLSAGMILVVLGSITALIGVVAVSLLALSFADPEKLKTAGLVIGGLIVAIGAIAALLLVASQAAAAPQALIALAIIVGVLLAIAVDLLAVAAIIGTVSSAIKSISDMIKSIKDLIEMLKDMDDADADKVAKNIMKILGSVAIAIPAAFEIYYEESTKSVTKLFPKVLKFIATQLIPFLDNMFGIIIPSLVIKVILLLDTMLNAISNYMPNVMDILDKLVFAGDGLLFFIFAMLDRIWDNTVSWIDSRIPVWVADIAEMLLILIKAINAAFEDKWDEFDEEIQLFIDHVLDLLTDLLTNQKTKDDVSELIGGIFSRIKEVLSENEDSMREVFSTFGRVLGSALVGGINDLIPDDGIFGFVSGGFDKVEDLFGQNSYGVSPIRGSERGYTDISSYGMETKTSDIVPENLIGYVGTNNVNNRNPSSTSTSSKGFRDKIDVEVTVDGSPKLDKWFNGLNGYLSKQIKSGSSVG